MQTSKVIDYIVNWLKSYCDGAGLHGFVAGISGGIDSAVTSRPIRMLPQQANTTRNKNFHRGAPNFEDALKTILNFIGFDDI